jgi:hypothetical protein
MTYWLAVLAIALGGCAAPARMGLARVQVCLTGETASRWDKPRPQKGASVCADFERPPEPSTE